MGDRSRPYLSVIFSWLFFATVGAFIAFITPLGEGIDEMLHWDYVQFVAERKAMPLGHAEGVSRETATFLENHPVAWVLHGMNPQLPAFEEYWQQTESRDARDRVVRDLRFSGEYVNASVTAIKQYESHQAPLYYVLAASAFSFISRTASYLDTFLWLRLITVAIASFMIPGTFLLAKAVLEDSSAAAVVTRLLVLFPGLYPGVVRVSNDALAAVLATFTLLFLISFLKSDSRSSLYIMGILLVAGLWTKAFFLPVAAGILLSLVCYRRFRAAGLIALLCIAGLPWYVYTYSITGSLSGLPETVVAATSVSSSAETLRRVDWENVVRVAVRSHIWAGNWSLLGVRSWMYGVIAFTALAGLVGLLLRPLRTPRNTTALVLVYISFAAGLAYYATQVFQAVGLSVAQGWYLTLLIPVEFLLIVAGSQALWGKSWWVPVYFLQLIFVLFMVYSEVFVAMPYYSGLTAHATSGHLTTYHPALQDFMLMTTRLLRFQPSIPTYLPLLLLMVAALGALFSMGSAARGHYRARSASTFRR